MFFVHFFRIIQNGKTFKGSEILEIKIEQNHTFRTLFIVFLELQGINTVVGNALFLLYCMKKNESALITTSEKIAVFSQDFYNCDLCQFRDIFLLSFSVNRSFKFH